jgi:hypothetical protein
VPVRFALFMLLASCASLGPVLDTRTPTAPALCCLHRVDAHTVIEVCAPPSDQHVRYCLARGGP